MKRLNDNAGLFMEAVEDAGILNKLDNVYDGQEEFKYCAMSVEGLREAKWYTAHNTRLL